jgi:hypothetical protein
MALETVGPLPKTKHGNRYVLIIIDHYSKWCKTKAIIDHDVPKTIARFLEDEVICKFGVPKYILTDNGFESFVEFDQLWKNYSLLCYLPHLNIHNTRITNYPKFCLDTNVGFM